MFNTLQSENDGENNFSSPKSFSSEFSSADAMDLFVSEVSQSKFVAERAPSTIVDTMSSFYSHSAEEEKSPRGLFTRAPSTVIDSMSLADSRSVAFTTVENSMNFAESHRKSEKF